MMDFKTNKIALLTGILVLLCTYGKVYAGGATNSTYNNTSVVLSNSTGCATSTYTFTQRTDNDKKVRHQSGVATATITFPAGTDASTFTSGTCNGSAITIFTATATTFTFTFPAAVGKNRTFTIVLNGITNGDNLNANATISASNTSSGQNTGTYPFTTTACPTCFDGIQNQGETGVDCGGPCSACPTCTDGIQNQGETGVDCGGPCSACPTCSDGIQNQGELGVDCGGPCSACAASSELYNVIVNNSNAGINFLSDMVTHTSGVVTLTNGVLETNAFEVYTLNSDSNSITIGHTGSYVQGNLRRDLNTTGSYHFPVGNASKGYELANIDFTVATEIRNLAARFDDWGPIAGPTNESECGTVYDGAPLDNGFWTIDADTLDSTGVYDATLYNRNYTNWNGTTMLAIIRDGGSGYTLRNGNCSANNPDTVIRTGMYGFSEFATAQGSVPLPIHMLSFNGRKVQNTNNLYWETDNSTAIAYFNLYRSTDGAIWEKLKTIDAIETSNGSTPLYEYNDTDPENGWNYYRLKQVLKTGETEFSTSIKINNSKMDQHPIIYPNPSKGYVFMSYEVTSQDVTPKLEIVNSVGQLVYTSELDSAIGSHSKLIDLHTFGSDLYYFRVVVNQNIYTDKVIIRR